MTEAPPEAPAASAAAPSSPNLNNAFAELEGMFPQSQEVSVPSKQEGDEPAEQPAPESRETKPQPKPAQNNEVKKPDPPKTPDKPPATPEQPVKAKTLREAKEMAEAKAAEWQKKYEQIQKEASTPKEDPEKKTLAERLAEREKRLSDLEQELKYSNYERSQEYKDKYEQPFITAYTAARNKVSNLKVRDGRQVDAEGNVVSEGTLRQGTPADFDTLMRISDDEQAADFADKVFGNKSSIAMFHRERVQELNSARLQSIEEYRKNGSEREKQFKEVTDKQQKEIGGQIENYWKKHQAAPIEKYPHLFKEVDGDEKGNTLLQKGYKMANDAFASFSRVGDPSLTPDQREQIIASHAAVFNWAMAGPRLAHQNAELSKQIKEMKSKLDAYEESEPTGGTARRPAAASTKEDMESVLSSLESLTTRR